MSKDSIVLSSRPYKPSIVASAKIDNSITNLSVSPVLGARIILITIKSSLTLDDVWQLAAAQSKFIKELKYEAGEFGVLIDGSSAAIQPIAVSDALAGLSQRDDFHPARLAFVHGDAAAKMQVRRVNAGKPDTCLFATQTEALTWLRNELNSIGLKKLASV